MIDLTIAVPVLVALVEVIKRLGMTSRFAPAVSILLGFAFFLLWGDSTLLGNLFEGLISGLAASGLYSGAKATVNK